MGEEKKKRKRKWNLQINTEVTSLHTESWSTSSFILTKDRHDDHYEVEEIPRLLEVVPTEGEHLQNTFGGEDAYEDEIQVVEHHLPFIGHIVVIQSHRKHVQSDENHDDHVKLLVGHYLEHHGLWAELSGKDKENRRGDSFRFTQRGG